MAGFDAVEVFTPLLNSIQRGEIKTAYQLRMSLEIAGAKYDVTTLNMLLLFREWLGENGLDISTEHGGVALIKLDVGK